MKASSVQRLSYPSSRSKPPLGSNGTALTLHLPAYSTLAMANTPTLIVVGCIGYICAILSTIIRLIQRRRRQQLWWDDFWASIALFTAIYMLSIDIVKWSGSFETLPILGRSFILWSNFWAQTATIWASRVSVQITIVYFLPSGRNRTISKWAAGGLGISSITSGVSKMFYNGLPIPRIPSSPFGRIPTGINMGLGVVATTWLIGWPAFLVSRMKLRRRVKAILLASFGSGTLLFATEIFHCVNLVNGSQLVRISGQLALVSSVVTSNMVILVALIYQHLNPDTDHGHRCDSTTSGESEDGNVGGIPPTNMTQFTSLVEPLTELDSSDLQWSRSGRSAIIP
ncbi:hypothetical protein BKA70DRAFT_113604 [Coprinopsis sp. MPI-PUGE-AT-0042]|nr:hypothetical protein BKA70DRAFT_113604 [Coprinopsis sp. MPI-PUGE-AT-0042]